MAYPIEQLKPNSSEEEQRAALQATIEQLVSEGKSPEDAQSTATSMLQQLLQPSLQVPAQGPTDYGLNVQSQRTKLARSSNGTRSAGYGAQNYEDSYNLPRGQWNSPWNPSPAGPSGYVHK